jgi:hypothetical protein
MLSYSKNWEYEHIDDGKQHPDVSSKDNHRLSLPPTLPAGSTYIRI